MDESIRLRVGRLISGSINAIIDKAESTSPEIIMKETIREVVSTIDEVKVLLGKKTIELRKSKSQLENETAKYNKLAEQIEIAISEKRDDLAKSAISRQLDIEAQFPILEDTISNINQNIKKLEDYIDALNAKEREMNQELQEFINIKLEQKESLNIESNLERAQKAFNRVNEEVDTSKFLKKDDIQLAELDKLTRDNRIEERLQSIKANKK